MNNVALLAGASTGSAVGGQARVDTLNDRVQRACVAIEASNRRLSYQLQRAGLLPPVPGEQISPPNVNAASTCEPIAMFTDNVLRLEKAVADSETLSEMADGIA